ncbi:MAG: glycosyl hydrolase family 28 protein [Bacteroidota bacterium]
MKGALLFLMALVFIPFFGQNPERKILNVLDYGVIPDGKTLNTQTLQKIIDETINVKGILVFPQGTYITGALHLGANMTLQLNEGATLLASPDINHYPDNVFLKAAFADNLTIQGRGTINGNGTAFFDANWNFTQRPEPFIEISDSKNVSVKGIRLENSPSHTLKFSFCEEVLVDGITIKNDPRSRNTDGIDLVNTRNVEILNCSIATGDDAICLKNTRHQKDWIDPKGNPRPKITENIRVASCYLESDDSALKLGTGSGYCTQNVVFEDITIRNTRYAIGFFMMDGGLYQNILFKNINVETGSRHPQEYGVFMDIHQRKKDSKVGKIQGITFEDCSFTTKGIFYLSGHPEQNIKDIEFKNVDISFTDNLNTVEWHKPKGNKKIKQWETTSDFTRKRGKIIMAHAEGIQFNGLTIKKASKNYPIFWERNTQIETTNLLIQ